MLSPRALPAKMTLGFATKKWSQMKTTPKLFVLIGMMGAGKTSSGKVLSRRVGWDFVDLDQELESRTGVSIPEIFESEGEQGFRQRETDLLKEFLNKEQMIISSGGGIVLKEENRKLLKRSKAEIIFLEVTPEDCLKRTEGTSRPLLRVKDPLGKIKELLSERTALYEEVSTCKISTSKKRPGQIAGEIMSKFFPDQLKENQ